MTIRIYIEGGGDGRILDTLFRQGWQRFFQAAGLSGHMPAVVRGGGRTQTWDMFVTAVSVCRHQVCSLELKGAGHGKWPPG